jgi:hypothetical protein
MVFPIAFSQTRDANESYVVARERDIVEVSQW